MSVAIALPRFERHAVALRVTTLVSILTHTLVLGALAWTFPYHATPEPLDQGISIDLAQVETPPPPEPPVVEPEPQPQPPEPVASPEPAKAVAEEPMPTPKPQPKKVEKPKPKPAPQKMPTAVASNVKPTQIPKPGAVQTRQAPAKVASTPPAPAGGLNNPKPPYPELARKRGQEGVVRVRCQVDSAGAVTGVSLAQTSGHKLLDEAALKTVRKWRFRPAMDNGAPVSGSVVVPVSFRLK